MKVLTISAASISLIAGSAAAAAAQGFTIDGSTGNKLSATAVAEFDSPWAMTFLPNGNLLVTTKPGKLWLVSQSDDRRPVSGLPTIAVGG